MWIERDWAKAIRALARSYPSVLLTGSRQVGKTALLRRLYPTAAYVTFDDPGIARQAETDPEAFFRGLAEPILLDEVQYVPSLFRRLKKRIDEDRRPGRFLLTGSQTFSLMENVSESLAGRCGILEMSTLSFREARRSEPDLRDLEFLVRGGFPAVSARLFERPSDFYTSYLASYLERDVRNLKAITQLRDFDRFLRAAALRTGQILSYSDLARDVGIAPNTAKSWISVLQASGQVFVLEPYHRNLTTRLIKSPKLHFMDAGLACHLIGIRDERSLLDSPLAGALWETFVVGQVVRHFQVERERPPLWYWHTARHDEVDLLVERGARFVAIECKLAETPDERALRGLRALEAYYGPRSIEAAYVVCRTAASYRFEGWKKGRALGVLDLAL
jgi:predicted AAA+ superfamily ATPase